jgi:hypothetical protein
MHLANQLLPNGKDSGNSTEHECQRVFHSECTQRSICSALLLLAPIGTLYLVVKFYVKDFSNSYSGEGGFAFLHIESPTDVISGLQGSSIFGVGILMSSL